MVYLVSIVVSLLLLIDRAFGVLSLPLKANFTVIISPCSLDSTSRVHRLLTDFQTNTRKYSACDMTRR